MKDAYRGLPDAEATLDEYTDAAEKGSDAPPEEALRDALAKTGAGGSPEAVEAAERAWATGPTSP